MLELYCELLLARAGVLDQIAFSERGIKGRAKAKAEEAARARAKAAKAAGKVARGSAGGNVRGSGNGGGGGGGGGKGSGGGEGGFGWFRSSSKASSAPAETGSPASEGSAGNNPAKEDTQQQQQQQQRELEQQQQEEDYRQTQSYNSDSDSDSEEECYLDPGLDEAAAAIFYAVPRFPREVRELGNLRILLMERWGKDFASLTSENKAQVKVPERLVKSLKVKSPSRDLVENYLKEIARAYKVDWPPAKRDRDEEEEGDDDDDLGAAPSLPGAPRGGVDGSDNNNNSNDGGGGGDNGIPSVPKTSLQQDKGKSPTNNSNNNATNRDESASTSNAPPPATTVDGRVIPEVDELARRFAALKR